MFKTIYLVFSLIAVSFFLFFWLNPLPVPQAIHHLQQATSIGLYSREGTLLRETLSALGGRRSQGTLSDVSPEFLSLLLATEDQHFYYHPGVDPLATGRALIQLAKTRRVVSGASTITMQLARMQRHNPRNWQSKVLEAMAAVRLEMSLSKKAILELYLNHLPFGNEIYGLSEASAVYFKKTPKDLSLAESAFLLGIIRSPTRRNPYTEQARLLVQRDRILNHYAKKNPDALSKVTLALSEKLVLYPFQKKFAAPHFTDFVLRNLASETLGSNLKTVTTSLDLSLEEKIQIIVKDQLNLLREKNVSQASVLVVSNKTGEILAYVGSSDYWDGATEGMNDGVMQMRQPGSTLKPFTYARALDVGILPTQVLADVPTEYESDVGDYIPENYDKKYRGPVLMRTALANSLNIPAVELLGKMGVAELYHTLKDLNFSALTEVPSYYGLGLTLGNVEVNLYELVRAYSIFARAGEFCDLTFYRVNKTDQWCFENHGEKSASEQEQEWWKKSGVKRRVLTQKTVAVIRDFLSDRRARLLAFGSNGPLDFDQPVMIKTGTSQGFRDNWTVAVTPEYTIGAWTGNFNGSNMAQVSGVSGAAPIVHKIVDVLYEEKPWTKWNDPLTTPKQKVCALSGKRITKDCSHTRLEFVREGDTMSDCDFHKRYNIDVREGVLAQSSCPTDFVALKPYVDLPPVYRAWQLENMPQTIAPQGYSSLCAATVENSALAQSETLRILSPKNGAVYKIDLQRPKAAQYLSLRTSDPRAQYVILLNGRVLSLSEASHMDLVPGKYVLKLMESGNSDSEKVLDQVAYEVR